MKTNIYLEHLKLALAKVDIKYFSSYAFRGNQDNIKRMGKSFLAKYEQYIERIFTYELYHQFRCIMFQQPRYYQNLVLNSEVSKINFERTILKQHGIIPDLVLHKSQTDRSPNYQTLFIEIKTRPNKSILNDIKKLLVAVSDRLNFQYGVMICINYDDEILEKFIKKAIRKIRIGNKEMLLNKLFLLTEKKIVKLSELNYDKPLRNN